MIGILGVRVQSVAADAAREVATSLQKEHRLTKEEAGEGIGNGKRRKYKESVGGDALQHVDLVVRDIRRRISIRAGHESRSERRSSRTCSGRCCAAR